MKAGRFLIVCICLFSVPGLSYAQESRAEMLQQALSAYEIGKFQTVLDVLDGRVEQLEQADQIQAYRLCALSALAMDNTQVATEQVSRILKIEPYYAASLGDPLSYSRLVKEMQSGKLTLVTASQLTETLEEVPVPVTLITARMIKESGASNLKEVLTWFVPGMTPVEGANEVNVSMRGVYSSSQQKILIMLNGHRLNSRSYNSANPDYSISLEKIKQIEVLRGPASSLYGNVALTAVVNIITKDGMDVDGMYTKVGLGSYGERRADLLIGKRFMSMDVMAWGSLYRADGQKVFVPASESVGLVPHDGYGILGGYNKMPSFDYGFTYKWNDFKVLFSQRYGKMVDPFLPIWQSQGGTYRYDQYTTLGSIGPGASFNATHAEVSYAKTLGNFAFDVTFNYDYNKTDMYSAVCDSVVLGGNLMRGIYQNFTWYENALGTVAKAGYQYEAGSLGTGNVMLGGQYEYMKVYDYTSLNGINFTEASAFNTSHNGHISLGRETSLSFFLQEKHRFNARWILNAGVRYDHKLRANDKTENAFSPRVSLIYLPSDTYNVKLSYARSFVDAPYYYRFNSTNSYRGSVDLKPENLDAVQLTFSYVPNARVFRSDFNVFLNRLTNFIYKDPNATSSATDPIYINAGKLNTLGFEASGNLTLNRFTAICNFTWQYVLSGENYAFRDRNVYHIPQFSGNLLCNWQVLDMGRAGRFDLRGNLVFAGSQLAPYENIYIGGVLSTKPDNRVPARLVPHIGCAYTLQKLEVQLQCRNLLNTTFYQGGTTVLPYRQTGRWFSASIAYTF